MVALMKHLVCLVLLAFLLPESRAIRIVALYDGSYSTDAWNRRHESARAAAVSRLVDEGYEVSSALEQSVSVDRIEERYAYHSSTGADIIITTNFVHREAFLNFTKTPAGSRQHFITGAALGTPTNNSFSIYGNVFSAIYLAGKACGLSTTTNNVGIISLAGTRGGNAQINAFAQGVKAVNPAANVFMMQSLATANSSVVERYIGLEMIDKYNVDCMVGGNASPGAYAITKIRPNVNMIGLYEDLRYSFGENVLFSVLYDWTSLYLDGIHGFINGTFPGRRTVWGPLGSTVVLSDYSTKMSPSTIRIIDETERRIIAGTECIFPWEQYRYIYPASEFANTVLVYSPNNITVTRCLSQLQIQAMPAFMLTNSPFNTLPAGSINNAFVIQNPRNWTAADVIVENYVPYSDPGAIIFLILACLGLVTSIGCIIFVLHFRDIPIVRATSPIFMLIITGGCIFMFSSIFMFYGVPSTSSCHLRLWLFFLGYTLAMSALLVKNWRIWRIFSNDTMSIFAIKSNDLLFYGVIPATVIMIVLLVLWTTLNPYHLVYDTFSTNLNDDHVNLRCYSDSNWSVILTLVVAGLLLFFTVLISLLNRNLGYAIYRETRQVALSSYNTIVVALGCLVISLASPYTVWIEANVQAGAIALIAWGIMVFIFLERVKIVIIDGKTGFETSSSNSTTKGDGSSKRNGLTMSAQAQHGSNRISAKSQSGSKSAVEM